MTLARNIVVASISTSAQPVSPADGANYLIGAGATGSDWAGQDGNIAFYDSIFGWTITLPRHGDVLTVNDGTGNRLVYTPSGASPSETWVRASQFLVTGGGSASSNLTTSFATLTEFTGPERNDAAGSFGCFDWEGTSSGTMDLARDCYGPLKIRATFSAYQTAAGNQNTFTVKLQKDGGSGFADVPGTTMMGNTFADTSMWGQAVTIIYSDDAASSGDAYRFQAQVESDSSSNIIRIEQMTVEMEERHP